MGSKEPMVREEPDYYVYKGVQYLDCPKDTKLVKYKRNKETGQCYAVVKRTHKRLAGVLLAVLCILCIAGSGLILWWTKNVWGVKADNYTLYCPSQAVSFERGYVYLGLQAGDENPTAIWLCLIREDGVPVSEWFMLGSGEFVGVLGLTQPLRDGAENYVLEIRGQEKLDKLGQAIVTLIYMGE